jgi:hypothetical protein
MAFIRVLLLLGFALPACAGQNDSALLSRIDAYLNSYPRLQAQFIQTAPGGEISEGMLYLERPGKMRWEYAPPSPVLLVAEAAPLHFSTASWRKPAIFPPATIGWVCWRKKMLCWRIYLNSKASRAKRASYTLI